MIRVGRDRYHHLPGEVEALEELLDRWAGGRDVGSVLGVMARMLSHRPGRMILKVQSKLDAMTSSIDPGSILHLLKKFRDLRSHRSLDRSSFKPAHPISQTPWSLQLEP